MKDLAGAVLGREDYERLAERCRLFDDRFPDTYSNWERLIEKANALVEAGSLEPVPIDIDEFRRWCARTGVTPCLDALRAFMVVKRGGRPGSSSPLQSRRQAGST